MHICYDASPPFYSTRPVWADDNVYNTLETFRLNLHQYFIVYVKLVWEVPTFGHKIVHKNDGAVCMVH